MDMIDAHNWNAPGGVPLSRSTMRIERHLQSLYLRTSTNTIPASASGTHIWRFVEAAKTLARIPDSVYSIRDALPAEPLWKGLASSPTKFPCARNAHLDSFLVDAHVEVHVAEGFNHESIFLARILLPPHSLLDPWRGRSDSAAKSSNRQSGFTHYAITEHDKSTCSGALHLVADMDRRYGL